MPVFFSRNAIILNKSNPTFLLLPGIYIIFAVEFSEPKEKKKSPKNLHTRIYVCAICMFFMQKNIKALTSKD